MNCKATVDKKVYIAHRVCEAIDRLLAASTFEDKEKAALWTRAWCDLYSINYLTIEYVCPTLQTAWKGWRLN